MRCDRNLLRESGLVDAYKRFCAPGAVPEALSAALAHLPNVEDADVPGSELLPLVQRPPRGSLALVPLDDATVRAAFRLQPGTVRARARAASRSPVPRWRSFPGACIVPRRRAAG